jgi:Uma2 family endonuclease
MAAYNAASSDRPLTLEEFEALPEPDGYRLDLVRGRIVREPAPGGQHGMIAAELGRLVGNFVRRRRLGFVFAAETGFVLSENPPTARGPDLAFVAEGRFEDGVIPASMPRLAPDLAVEVVSPSNTWSDVAAKVRDYLEAGTRLVWIVDPRSRTVTVHRGGEPPQVVGGGDPLDGADVLPGFRLKVERLFG